MARRLAPVVLTLLLTGPLAGAASAASVNWSSPKLVDHQPPFASTPVIHAVSCPTPRLCVGVEESGVVTSTRPTSGAAAWSATSFRGIRGYSGALLGSVSCPSARFCAVVDDVGDIFTSTHPTAGQAAWKRTRAPRGFSALSCPTSKLCVGAAGGVVASSSNPAGGRRAWHLVPVGPSFEGLVSIDCSSPHLCVAAGVNGDAATIASSTKPTSGARAWKLTTLRAQFLNFTLSSVSCASIHLCVLTDSAGGVVSSTCQGRPKTHPFSPVENAPPLGCCAG